MKPHQYHAVHSFGSRGSAQGQFDNPFSIAISDKTGSIAVSDFNNDRVQLFSSDGIYLREYGQKGLDPKTFYGLGSVAFNKSGDIIISDCRGIFCFTESGQFIKDISKKHLNNPLHITIADDGRMLVCDLGDSAVKVLSPDGKELMQSFSCDEVPLVALCHQDMFYIPFGSARCVKVFNNEGGFLYNIGVEGPGKLNCPLGLAVDKFKNLLVCDGSNVKVFTLEGKFLNSLKGQQMSTTVAVSNAGQVFITDAGKHCVHVFE